jgi:LAO/AO transport system kinase
LGNTRLTLQQYKDGILSGDRIILARAITLIESSLPEDLKQSASLIDAVLPHTGNSIRIGITGVPGVGKSTFIETFGKYVTGHNKKIAVLTVDPSSQLTKGSILGDKTRMEELSRNKLAFIRPSASGETLGGVSNKTREAMLLCEASGYDVIIIETVGVGQSEIAVKNMVDFFLLLMLAGAGDELQGIKKGIMEMADAVVITKADGGNMKHASKAKAEYQQALHLLHEKASGWSPAVITCSAFSGDGIEQTWEMINKYQQTTQQNGYLKTNRQHQNLAWFNEYFQGLLQRDLLSFNLMDIRQKLESEINRQRLSPQHAAFKLLQAYHEAIQKNK